MLTAAEKFETLLDEYGVDHYRGCRAIADLEFGQACDCGRDHAIAALRAALAGGTRETEGWRPIAEAPKDGTYVLICGTGGIHMAHWACGRERYQMWLNFDSHGVGAPTHWMPLPAPPSTTEEPR